MELKGSLDSRSLQEIFTTLARNKQIGTLIVSDGESTKYIYFARAGVRLLSSGKRKNIRLGDLLVKLNKITPDQLQAVLARQEETGEMVGKIITDWGLVTEQEIDEAVASQIEEEIFDLFTWDNANFKFTEGAPPKELFDPNQRATRLTFDVTQMVQKAAQYVDEIHRAKELLPPPDTVFQLGEFTELEFYERDDSDPVKRIVKAIDGFRTVAEVVGVSGSNQLQAAEILGMLIRDKKIEKVEAPRLHAEPGKELSDFVGQCEQELEKDPANLALRERLAQAYFDLGDSPRAVHHLSQVVREAMKSERLEEAMTTAHRIAEIAPDDIENQEQILKIHFELRDTDGVLSTAAVLADLYWSAGDTERVKNMYKLVLEIVPDDIEIRKKLINLYLDGHDRDGAADEYEAIANILEKRGNTAGMYEIYQKISRLAPHRKDLLKRLKSTADKPVVRIPRSRFHIVKRLVKLLLVLAVLGAVAGAIGWEIKMREEAQPRIEEAERLRSDGKCDEANEILKGLKDQYRYTLMAYLILPGKIEEVEKARREEEERERQDAKELLDKYRVRWEELRAEETEVRKHEGAALIEKLNALEVEIKAFASSGQGNEYVQEATAWLKARRDHVARAEALLKEAEALEKDRCLLDGRKRRKRILVEFKDTPFVLNMKMPFQVLSEPSGAEVFDGENKLGETPLMLYQESRGPLNRLVFTIRMAGYFETRLELDTDQIEDRTDFKVGLKRKPLWFIKTGEAIEAPPAVKGTMVYTGSRDGLLYAVDTQSIDPAKEGTWRPAWTYEHPSQRRVGLGGIIFAPRAYKDLVIFPRTDSFLYAVRNGTLVWDYGIGAGNTIVGSPQVAEDRVVIGVGKGKRGYVMCLPVNPPNAQRPFWVVPSASSKSIPRLAVPPLLDAKTRAVYFGTNDGIVYSLDLFSGYEIGRFDLNEPAAVPLAFQDGVLFVVTQDWTLRAVDFSPCRKGGAPFHRWKFHLGEHVTTGLLAFGGWVVVCTEIEKKMGADAVMKVGKITVLDARDPERCEIKWTFETGGVIKALPVVSLNRLYVGSYDRNIYALFFWEGKEAWRFTSQGRINGLVVREGVIYATTKEGELFAVKSQ